MNESRKLLDDYAKSGSEAAFRELVDRYVNMVHSTALRLVNGDSHLAQDVTQTVFLNLARKAGTLSGEVMIGGWLHRHACFVASTMMRGNRRRQIRERQAVEMNANEDHSAANLSRVAPLLDDAIDELGPEDRAAILLRFFEQLEFRAVGHKLGTNEDAARMRVNRALDKLHSMLTQRGVTLSAAALGTALAAEAVKAAPIGMAASIATAALGGVATGGTTLTIAKIMSMTHMKIAFVSAIAVAVMAAPAVMQHQSVAKLREENQALQQQVAQLSPLQAENQRLSNLVVQSGTGSPAQEKQVVDLARLRAEVSNLRQQTNEMAKTVIDLRQSNQSQSANRSGKRVLRNCTMAQLARFIGGVLVAPVSDQTGLTGTYDIVLTAPRLGGEDGKVERVTGILLNELGLQLIPFAGPFTGAEMTDVDEGRTVFAADPTPNGASESNTIKGGFAVQPRRVKASWATESNPTNGGFALRFDHADAPGLKASTGEPESDSPEFAGRWLVDADSPYIPKMMATALRFMDSSKQQWALEKRKQTTDTPTWDDLRPYIHAGTNETTRSIIITSIDEQTMVIGSVGQKTLMRTNVQVSARHGDKSAGSLTATENQCINNLRIIDSAKQQWALEFRKQNTDTPTMEDLREYIARGDTGELPTCPDGGVYTVGSVGKKATCSVAGHVLP